MSNKLLIDHPSVKLLFNKFKSCDPERLTNKYESVFVSNWPIFCFLPLNKAPISKELLLKSNPNEWFNVIGAISGKFSLSAVFPLINSIEVSWENHSSGVSLLYEISPPNKLASFWIYL